MSFAVGFSLSFPTAATVPPTVAQTAEASASASLFARRSIRSTRRLLVTRMCRLRRNHPLGGASSIRTLAQRLSAESGGRPATGFELQPYGRSSHFRLSGSEWDRLVPARQARFSFAGTHSGGEPLEHA
jgi:hypothetical protein